MTRPQLIAIEAGILAIGLVIVYALVGWPFGGSDHTVAVADPTTTAHTLSSVTVTPAPHPTPAGATDAPTDNCGPAVTPSFLSANQVVSYYGNPYAQTLGILGEHSAEELVPLLKQQAATIDGLNGIRGVEPAFHIVYATAQGQPGNDGLYLQNLDDDTIRHYIDVACQNHFLVFLDLQNGRSDPLAELQHIEPFLRSSNVHVAMDPEFTMSSDEVPGQAIGHLDASQINAAQQELESFVEQSALPDKILVVHQFDDGMITNPDQIQSFPHVQLVIDMDGFGPADGKVSKFEKFAQPAENSGIKIFFHQDDPRLTDEEVVALDPDLIIYQ